MLGGELAHRASQTLFSPLPPLMVERPHLRFCKERTYFGCILIHVALVDGCCYHEWQDVAYAYRSIKPELLLYQIEIDIGPFIVF